MCSKDKDKLSHISGEGWSLALGQAKSEERGRVAARPSPTSPPGPVAPQPGPARKGIEKLLQRAWRCV